MYIYIYMYVYIYIYIYTYTYTYTYTHIPWLTSSPPAQKVCLDSEQHANEKRCQNPLTSHSQAAKPRAIEQQASMRNGTLDVEQIILLCACDVGRIGNTMFMAVDFTIQL